MHHMQRIFYSQVHASTCFGVPRPIPGFVQQSVCRPAGRDVGLIPLPTAPCNADHCSSAKLCACSSVSAPVFFGSLSSGEENASKEQQVIIAVIDKRETDNLTHVAGSPHTNPVTVHG